MSRPKHKRTKQAIPAAWAVRSPENQLVFRGSAPSMSDEELREWSKKRVEPKGIRQAAIEAAGRGVTLMAFDHQTNASYPYMPELVEEFKAAEEKTRIAAAELHGLYDQGLTDFVSQDSNAQAA